MNRHILYFINPISGTRSKQELIKTIQDKTAQEGIRYQLAYTNAEGDYNYLKEKIVTEAITDVVICGGDGTVSQVGASLSGIDVNTGIIPLGSGNGLALAAKIPRDLHSALSVIFSGKAAYVDGFFINNKFSCMLCGLGFDALVAHEFARQRKRGLATYVRQTLLNFFSAKAYPFSISYSGRTIDCKAYFISIANSNQFGNNVTIAPRASLSDGLLDVVVVKKMNKFMLICKLLWQIKRGKTMPENSPDFEKNSILYFNAASLTVHNPSLAPLHIDGDPAETAEEVRIKVIPAALRLLQG
jgi:diacylglycerol kinase (ATP)